MRSLTWMTRRDVQLSGFRESRLPAPWPARGRNTESESQTTCGARARAVEFLYSERAKRSPHTPALGSLLAHNHTALDEASTARSRAAQKHALAKIELRLWAQV